MPAKKKAALTLVPDAPDTDDTTRAPVSVPIEGLTDARLLAVAEHGARDLLKALIKHENQILEDIERMQQEEGDKAKFKVSLGVTLNLADGSIDISVGYSIKLAEKTSHYVTPEEPHPELFFGGKDDA